MTKEEIERDEQALQEMAKTVEERRSELTKFDTKWKTVYVTGKDGTVMVGHAEMS